MVMSRLRMTLLPTRPPFSGKRLNISSEARFRTLLLQYLSSQHAWEV